ncbi:MAG: hypothetical protein ND895_18565 [Pyrinomonadaceae bacterium]|nr:hypothetical protein [Pyrinomonadaceae bacterium]
MRLIIKLLICLCLLPATTAAQEKIRKFIVGPHGEQIRIVYAVTDILPDGYKLQSMIIDLARVKNSNEEPSFVLVDLTSTVRSLATGEKQQKILVLRWKKTGELEFKCDGNWTKQEKGAVVDKIQETTKSVIQSVPLNSKTPTEVPVTTELEQKLSLVFDSLNTQALPCLRDVH